ncbi:hypothetical protein ACLRGI_21580 [Paenarthrobacter nitroguajacolicus]|uniref:hypothetical protein n=1 Tax=Paenarthrobacter nitroguajacolicus TaxID=211146 RepID=UPI003AEE024B
MSDGPDHVERQYRRALRFYPSSWRRQFGDELLGVLMDVAADDQQPGATKRQIFSLCINGLLARITMIVGHFPAERRTLVATGATAIGTAAASTMMVLGELGRWFRFDSYGPEIALFGPFTSAASVVYLLWLVAFGATVLRVGRLRIATHVLVMVSAVLMPIVTALTGTVVAAAWYVPVFFAVASGIALLGEPLRPGRANLLMLWSAPFLAAGVTYAAYRRGAGSRMTFYGYKGHSWDQFPVMVSFALLLMGVAALLLSSHRALPWVTYLVGR